MQELAKEYELWCETLVNQRSSQRSFRRSDFGTQGPNRSLMLDTLPGGKKIVTDLPETGGSARLRSELFLA